MSKIKQLFVFITLLAGVAVAASSSAKVEKVLVCHNTGSETNPFVLLALSPAAAASHILHGDFYWNSAFDENCEPLTE